MAKKASRNGKPVRKPAKKATKAKSTKAKPKKAAKKKPTAYQLRKERKLARENAKLLAQAKARKAMLKAANYEDEFGYPSLDDKPYETVNHTQVVASAKRRETMYHNKGKRR
jgi:hypothetical protein